MDSGLSASDVALMSGNGGGFGGMGSEGLWVFALLILLFGGGGFGANGTRVGEQYSTQADIQRAVDFDTLKAGQASVISSVKDVAYNNLSEIRDVQSAINTGFANMQTCCCETQRAIDGVNFNNANNTAAINANTTAQTQKILDAISANRMADMQNQINQLQLAQALCGVPKSSPYAYGLIPQWGTCGCSNNI